MDFNSFPGSSAGKESACNAGDPGSIAGEGRSAGEAIGYPLQYFGLENSMNCPWGHKEQGRTEQLSLHFNSLGRNSSTPLSPLPFSPSFLRNYGSPSHRLVFNLDLMFLDTNSINLILPEVTKYCRQSTLLGKHILYSLCFPLWGEVPFM